MPDPDLSKTTDGAPEMRPAPEVASAPGIEPAVGPGIEPAAAAEAREHEHEHDHVDADWRRVSPKYLVVEVIGSLIGTVIVVGGLLVPAFITSLWWLAWIAAAVAVVSIVSIAFEPRRVRSIGYRLRADDLLFQRGIMFHREVSVPYGRMQLVDVTRGPIARALGLADLKFVTAAAATAVTVPGLTAEEADRLRDELVALAETRRAGL